MSNNKKRENLITSLAILKVNWDILRKDHIENFVPFVIEALRNTPNKVVSLQELQNTISEHFGFEIPQAVLKSILDRTKKRGFVKVANKVYEKIDGKLEESDFRRVREDIIREHEALIQKMIDFCNQTYGESLAPDKANETLVEYINLSGMKILGDILSGEPASLTHELNEKKKFFIGAFISHLLKMDPLGLSYLEKIIKGSAFYTALFLPDIGKIQQCFVKVDIYLDTPFLLKALGYSGKGAQEYSEELLNLLHEEGANLKIFEHTVHEIEGILDAAIYAISGDRNTHQRYGETIIYLIDSGYTPSDVEMLLSRLRVSIKSLRVEVVETPPHSVDLGLDEKRFEEIIREEVGYRRDQTLKRDIDSMTAIYRLRKSRKKYQIERCGAIFLTTNTALAYSCSIFFKEVFDGPSIPICIADHVLATIAWVKKPLKAPNLPLKMLIADCYAALNPSDKLWKKYMEEIEKQRKTKSISESDYFMLRYSIEARRELMNITRGDPDAFSEGTVEEILEAAKKAARSEVEAKLEEEKVKREEAEQKAREEKKSAGIGQRIQIERIRNISIKVSRWISIWVFICASIIMVIFAFGAYFILSNPLKLIFSIGLIILSLLNLILGITLIHLKRKVEVFVFNKFQQILFKFIGLPKDE